MSKDKPKSKFVGRDAFLCPFKRRYAELKIQGFGIVRIQNLSEGEMSRLENSVIKSKGGLNMSKLEETRRELLSLCVVDEEGTRVLSRDDVDAIAEMDGRVANDIDRGCRQHCGITDSDVEDMAKNSERIAASSSPTS